MNRTKKMHGGFWNLFRREYSEEEEELFILIKKIRYRLICSQTRLMVIINKIDEYIATIQDIYKSLTEDEGKDLEKHEIKQLNYAIKFFSLDKKQFIQLKRKLLNNCKNYQVLIGTKYYEELRNEPQYNLNQAILEVCHKRKNVGILDNFCNNEAKMLFHKTPNDDVIEFLFFFYSEIFFELCNVSPSNECNYFQNKFNSKYNTDSVSSFSDLSVLSDFDSNDSGFSDSRLSDASSLYNVDNSDAVNGGKRTTKKSRRKNLANFKKIT